MTLVGGGDDVEWCVFGWFTCLACVAQKAYSIPTCSYAQRQVMSLHVPVCVP